MIDLGPHAQFILLAYLIVALAMAGLIAWTVWDARRIERRLARLDAQGVRRRSGDSAL